MKFSERMGITPVSTVLQTDSMNDDLRNSLWNVLNDLIWERANFIEIGKKISGIKIFSRGLWNDYFKYPVDSRPKSDVDIHLHIRKYYFSCKWHEVYDFIEYIIAHDRANNLEKNINIVLERKLSGFRLIDGLFVPVTEEIEVKAVQQALDEIPFSGVTTHLKQAIQSLSDKENPDYRNSIKESISAVESMACELTGKPKASLGDALKELEKDKALHPALKNGFSALYGYTSDEGGIRHAMQGDPNLSVTDAKYFLITCSAFINYLKVKIDQS